MDIANTTATDIAKGYRSGDFTALDVVRAYIARIEKEDGNINAFLEVFDDAEKQAQEADKRLQSGDAHMLTGVPIATKDNILIEGKVASAASKMLENHVATYDSKVAENLRDAGAIFLGRTNMDEFAMGSSTEHSAFGPTKNPIDPTRVPGGSSGGSAAAVAADFVPVALGSETCGSIRQPSSLCGLIGLKPTYGAVSRSGLIAMGSSLDQIGTFSKTVADAELVFDTIRGIDDKDGTTLPTYEPHTSYEKTIGVPREFVDQADAVTKEAFEKSLDVLRENGYTIVDVEFPSAAYGLAAYYIVMPAEVSTNLARLDGMRYGHHEEAETLLDEYLKSRRGGFGPETRRRILLGTYVLSSGYYDAYYRRATALRSVLADDLESIFKEVSFIATPTTPGPAFTFGAKGDPLSMYLEDVFAAALQILREFRRFQYHTKRYRLMEKNFR